MHDREQLGVRASLACGVRRRTHVSAANPPAVTTLTAPEAPRLYLCLSRASESSSYYSYIHFNVHWSNRNLI